MEPTTPHHPPDRPNWILRLLLVGAGLAVVFAATVAIWIRVAAQRSVVVLSDGTRIELLGTAVAGKSFTTEKDWHVFARKHLPRAFQKWIPQPLTLGCSQGTNSVTVYLLVTAPPGNPPSQQGWDSYRAGDHDGFRYPRIGGSCSSGGPITTLDGLSLETLPRRDKSFVLELLDRTNGVVAAFTVANPVVGPFPIWTPEPLPQIRTNGPLTLTLKSLSTAGSPEYRYLKGVWSVETRDPLWRNARPGWLRASDATGNSGSLLSPDEPAWKITTLIHRKEPSDFTEAEKLTVPEISVPTGTNFHTVAANRTVAGILVESLLFVPAGRLVFTNQNPPVMDPTLPISSRGSGSTSSGTNISRYWMSDSPALFARIGPLADGDEVRFFVRTPDGKTVKLQENGYSTDSGIRTYHCPITEPISSASVALELIISHPLKFEFMVDPKEIRASTP